MTKLNNAIIFGIIGADVAFALVAVFVFVIPCVTAATKRKPEVAA